MLYYYLTILIAVAIQTTTSSSCPVLTTPALCGSEDRVFTQTECNSSSIDLGEFPPCCRLQAEHHRKCDDPAATKACRTMEITPALCPGNGQSSCCFEKDMSMKLHFQFEVTNKTCCSKCRCYGDPHCESFDGSADTWVVCDARTPKAGDISRCPMTKSMCLSQTDQNNLPCAWNNNFQQSTWSIALQGSPCTVNPSVIPPQMVMYASSDFAITLNMGERSIISDLIIDEGSDRYVLNAQSCFDYAYSTNRSSTPWKNDFGPSGQIPSEIDWLPKKWTWSPLDGQDVVWEVTGLPSLIDITVRCTRTPAKVAGKIKYGPPRLNVDIVEPKDWRDADARPQIAGFCPDGKITKQGSTSNTDNILAIGACEGTADLLADAQAVCGSGVTKPGIDACMMSWCKDHLPTTAAIDQVQQCINDIQQFSWSTEFCALNVFKAATCTGDASCLRTAKDCQGDASCRECVKYIADNGWPAAILTYDLTNNDVKPSDENCVTRANLPQDLIGDCQKGVRIQYKNPLTGEWTTQFAIPDGTCVTDGTTNGVLQILKSGPGEIDDSVLFYNPVRIIQCSAPDGTCLQNKCSQEIGFKAKIELDVKTSEFEKVWTLFQAGVLVCNPAEWASPTGCLDFTPPAMCPCNRL